MEPQTTSAIETHIQRDFEHEEVTQLLRLRSQGTLSLLRGKVD